MLKKKHNTRGKFTTLTVRFISKLQYTDIIPKLIYFFPG